MWSTSTACASGPSSILAMQGSRNANKMTLSSDMLVFAGVSEMVGYPIGTTTWDCSDPALSQSIEATANIFRVSPGIASEGIWSSVRYIGRLIFGAFSFGWIVWATVISTLDYFATRAKRDKDFRSAHTAGFPPSVPMNCTTPRPSAPATSPPAHSKLPLPDPNAGEER